jgi:hypothetical protein
MTIDPRGASVRHVPASKVLARIRRRVGGAADVELKGVSLRHGMFPKSTKGLPKIQVTDIGARQRNALIQYLT